MPSWSSPCTCLPLQHAGTVWPAHPHPDLCCCRLSRYQSLLASFADKASACCCTLQSSPANAAAGTPRPNEFWLAALACSPGSAPALPCMQSVFEEDHNAHRLEFFWSSPASSNPHCAHCLKGLQPEGCMVRRLIAPHDCIACSRQACMSVSSSLSLCEQSAEAANSCGLDVGLPAGCAALCCWPPPAGLCCPGRLAQAGSGGAGSPG